MDLLAHPAQLEFLTSPALYRGYVGGRGAGKSFVGALDLIQRALPNRLYMAAAPTYPLMRDATLRTFLDLGYQTNRIEDFRRADMTATLRNGAEVIFRSADDPDRTMRGPNLSGAWFDEGSVMDKKALDLTLAALREGGLRGWLTVTFTPRGKGHWTYDFFAQQSPDVALYHSRSIDNPFLPGGFTEGLRSQYTSAFAEQEIEGRFIDPVGRIAKREWFPVIGARPTGGRWVRAWDFAATVSTQADWTVGALMTNAGGLWTVAHVVRAQVAGGQVEALVKQTAAQDGPSVQIALEQEPGSSGKIASSYLTRALAGYNVRSVTVTGDKVSRAMPFLAQAEAGNVRLVAGPWVAPWLDEVIGFPDGAHDDQVDATAHAFNAMTVARSGIADPSLMAR